MKNVLSNTLNNSSHVTTKVAAIYVRVSTKEQAEEGYSIDEQVRTLKELCEREGYKVFKVYSDRGISGKAMKNRPGLQELLRDASQKAFNTVLVWKLNRLSRKSLDLLSVIDLLKKNNIAFRSATENYETETPGGVLQFQMMAAVAEFERANIAENVKMGMKARAREGSWNGGQVLGYDVVSTPSENNYKRKFSKLVLNELEAQTIRRIFSLYTSGIGYKSIANKLNKEGHRTKKDKDFSINAVRTILTNPLYAGYIRYNVRRDWNEMRRNNINPNPIIERGRHEPIISEETWEKTKSIMKSRGGRPNRIHSGEFPLTGILKCPVCGAGMVIGRTTNTNKDGTKRILEYYVCGAWKNKGTAVCRSNSIRTDYADKYVLEKLSNIAKKDKLIKDIVDKMNNGNLERLAPQKHEYETLKKKLEAIEARKDKVLGLYEEDIITRPELSSRLTKINEEKESLEVRLSPLAQQLSQDSQPEISFDMVREVMKNFVQAYKESMSREQRKHLLHLLIDTITVDEDRKIETIRIQLNKQVASHFTIKGGADSSISDEFAPPFSVFLDI
ncbi:recombinase family protein [Thalassobacillus sp. CUG 92003]|uniref:recombinase family protein n=1 Tax=Thalassobacillus sp. CUG 92003 TaxID=2736641 RepID=UPI0015E65DE6|nr:recombinase family protein [Thalassobacillus sp. CUG 92003]